MSTSNDAATKRTAVLDQLRFTKGKQRSAGSSQPANKPSTMSDQPLPSSPSYDMPHLPPQSRDATTPSRFFMNSSPVNMGNILVPNSSPTPMESYRPFAQRPVGFNPNVHSNGFNNGFNNFNSGLNNNALNGSFSNGSFGFGWPQLGPSTGIDPLTVSTGYHTGNPLYHPRPSGEESEPPRKRQHIEQQFPESPGLQRAPRRRNIAVTSDGAESDELPEVASRSRIVRKTAPEMPVLAAPDEDTLFTRFKFTMPQEKEDRVRAAWKYANMDVRTATQLLADPNWAPPPSSQISPPKEATGRVADVDEATRAQREMDKERAKKSMIYRRMPNRAVESQPSTSVLYATPPPSTRHTPVRTAPPPRKRAKKLVLDSESEFSESGSDDDDDEERNAKRLRQDNQERLRALEYFNTRSPEALQELTGCTPEHAKKIIELRPFESVEDLNNRLGQGKKKAGPGGISPRMFEDSTSIFQGYGTVDSILEDCEQIGNELRTTIDSWTSASLKGKEKECPTPTDEVEDGAFSLRSIAPLQDHRPDGYLDKQPSLLSPDVQLKEYQLLGVNWLRLLYDERYSCILADEMGLGKTIQVISFFAYLKEKGNKGPHLIIVPSSTLENWLREFNRFAPVVSVQAYYGGKDDRVNLRQELLDNQKTKNAEGWDILITTYNLAQGESDRKFFRRIEWDCCVFDEGHVLKNFQSQRYQSLLKVESRWRLLLTGTPLQNNLQELVSLMNFILPHHFQDAWDSLRAIFKVKGDSKVSLLAQERVSRAKKMMTPFVLRRRKDQVLNDLPKKTERIEWCEMTPLQSSIYKDAMQRSRKTVLDTVDTPSAETTDAPTPGSTGRGKGKKTGPKARAKDKVYVENSSNVLMDLRKAASHPMLFRKLFDDDVLTAMAKQLIKEPDFKKRGALFDFVKEDMTVMTDSELQVFCGTYKCLKKYIQDNKCYLDSGKIQILMKLLDQYKNEGRKVLIFSQFTQILDILQAIFKQREIRYLILTGSTAVDIRQTLVDEFTEDEGIPVFLLSTKAGGMGINLTAASVVIMFDHDFNPHNDRQAQDRAYRIGQKRDVDVVKLISRGTIEEHMLRLGETKLALDEAVAGEGDEKGESAPEREMKISLMKSLRQEFEEEHIGKESDATTPG